MMSEAAAFASVAPSDGGQRYGLRAALNLPSIRVLGDFVKKQGTGLEEREIPDYEVLYFPEATSSVYRVGDREHSLSKPCFVLTRPGEVHSYRYDPQKPTRHLFIHFWLKALPDDLLNVLLPEGPSVVPYQGELLFSLMKQINAIAYLKPENLQDRGSLLLLSLLSEIDALAANESPETERLPPQLSKALSVIDGHLASPLTVDDLARRVGWSPEHLSRSFSRYLGMTPKETIVRKKIDRACQLLLYGQKSVKEIAFEVGFADENYFCRVFKATKAITATDYRAKYYKPKYEDLAPANDEDASYPFNRVFFGDF